MFHPFHLDLSGTSVSDAGLKTVASLVTLTRLDRTHTQVTDAGVTRLQHALPDLSIER